MTFNMEEDIRRDFKELNKDGRPEKEILPVLADSYLLTINTIRRICRLIPTRFHKCQLCGKLFETMRNKIATDKCGACRKKKKKKDNVPQFTRPEPVKKGKEPAKYDLTICHDNCGEEFEYEHASSICRNCRVITQRNYIKQDHEPIERAMPISKINPHIIKEVRRRGMTEL